ncbi:MAG TPA: hypothetical protein VF478_07955 [Anaerolineae bacterium]
MKRSLFLLAATLWLGLATVSNASAQVNGRIIQLTLLLDYARGSVQVDGTVITPDGSRPDLSLWGFAETLPSWQDASRAWNVHGSISSGRIVSADAGGVYHVKFSSLVLAPGDYLTLKIPFVNVDYGRIDPPPDNLPALTSPNRPPDLLPSLLGLQYNAGSGRSIDLDIPFTLVRKQITLQATPLVGEMLLGRVDSFRISGRVVFDGLTDYGEFTRHCANDPASRVQYRYRVADLLFALDGLPIYNSGLLSNAYQSKPNYLLASVDLSSCQFDSTRGHVEANYSGRAFSVDTPSPVPPGWFPADQADANAIAPGQGGNAYELSLGSVVLGPGDILTVTVPASEIRSVQPPPTRYRFSTERTPEIAYEGPARFTLRITYAPQPELFLHQIPATGRVLVRSFETALRPLLDPRGAPLTWALLILALIFLAASRFMEGRGAILVGRLGWVLAAIGLYFGLRGAFGLMVLAVLVYVDALNDGRTLRSGLTRAGIALTLIFAAMYVDYQSENIFTLLNTLQLESTPVTPVIFLCLGAALAAVAVFASHVELRQLFPRINIAAVLVLIAFASFDVLQKSFLGLALIGLGLWYVSRRTARSGDKMHGTEVVYRIRSLWKSRFVPLGIVLMILFAAQSGLQSTTAVLGSSLGLLGTIVMPLLLLISIIQGFLAIGALFILVYPVLPFKSGFLKALALALFLLSLFIVGTGADDRLISTFESLIVGRLVYYVSVPLLIGLYFDIVQFMRTEQEKQVADGKTAAPLTIDQAAPMYFKRIQGLVGTVGALASLVAPGAYALFAGTPLVTTYFDILGKLAAVSLGG